MPDLYCGSGSRGGQSIWIHPDPQNTAVLIICHLWPAGEEAVWIVEQDGLPVGDEVHLGLQAQHLCLLSTRI